MVARQLPAGQAARSPDGPLRRVGGRYDVVAELGRGGMACVYRVVDAAAGGELALKQLLRQEDPQRAHEAATLFEREFRTLAQLSHPRVIEVYEYGLDDAGPFYTMELLDGGDLRERAPMPWREASEMVFDVCSSLALLHARRLVHRDVSPRNVRCTRDGHAKLIDFGAMVPMGAPAQAVGTPPFVPPEVVNGGALDARTDLYSLGNTLYYVLTGRFAYPAADFSQLVERWTQKPQRPSAIVPELPPALDQLVMSLIALEPALRPRSSFEVMERLATLANITRAEPLSVAKAYLVAPVLVGREEPLAAYREHLQRALHGRGRGIAIAGPAGSGRSRMLSVCALDAKMFGACVLRADAAGASREFAAARQLADCLLEAMPHAAVTAARNANAFEMLFEPTGTAANDARFVLRSFARPQAERPALSRALLRWIVQATKEQPILIAVDDADRIDESSLGLLVALAERARSCALLCLASIERGPGESPAPPIALLQDRCEVLELRALDATETEQLLLSVFDDVPNLVLLSARIQEVAAGNPRRAMELAQHLVDRGAIRYQGSGWSLPEQLAAADLPATAEDAFRARVDAVPPLARRLAEAHALSALPLLSRDDLRLLEPNEDPVQVDDAIDALIAAQVFAGDGRSFSLAHRSAVRVLTEALDSPTVRARHSALGHMFERTQRHTLRTGRHFLLGGEDERAFATLMPLLTGSKDRIELMTAAGLSVEDVIDTMLRALERACALSHPPREQCELRHWLCLISVMGDEEVYWAAAPDWFRQLELDSGLADWRKLTDITDPGQRLMKALQTASERHAATPEAERAYPPDEAIRLLVHYVVISIAVSARSLDVPLMLSLPDILVPFAPLSPLVASIYENALASVESSCFRQSERAIARWEKSYDALAHIQGQDPHIVASIRYAIAFGIGMNEAAMGLTHALHWAEVLDQDPMQKVNAMYLRKTVKLQQGDLEGAERYRKQAELLALQSNARQMFTNMLTLEINVHAMAWDLTGVKQIAARIAPLAERHAGWQAYPHLAEGHYQRLRGDLTAALHAYERCLESSTPHPDFPARVMVPWPSAASAYAETLLALGRAEEARSFATRTLAEAGRLGLVAASHEVARALALAEAKLGDYDAAVARLDDLIAQQLAKGVTGLLLGASYEARTRVAIWAGATEAVERFARLTAEQYRHGRGSPLGARYEHLMDEACGAGVMVLPPLSPFESTMFGNIEIGSRGSAIATIVSVMSGAQDSVARAQRALRLLCDSRGARSGHLFLANSGELRLAASHETTPPDDLLQRLVSDFWSQQSDDLEPDTAMLSESDRESGGLTQVWTDAAGRGYQPVLVCGTTDGGIVNAGVAILAREDTTRTKPEPDVQLVTELANFLIRSETVRP